MTASALVSGSTGPLTASGNPLELSDAAPSGDRSRQLNKARPATRLAPRIGSITAASDRSETSGSNHRSTVKGASDVAKIVIFAIPV